MAKEKVLNHGFLLYACIHGFLTYIETFLWFYSGVNQQLRGPNFTQFRPSIPSSGQLWTFYIIPTLCHVTKQGLSTDPLPLSS